MPDAPVDRSAVAGGLKRLVADAVVLRFIAEATLWRCGPGESDGIVPVVSGIRDALQEMIPAIARRCQVLDGTMPARLTELLRLSAIVPAVPADGGEDLSTLARGLAAMISDMASVAMIAREAGDDVTSTVLLARIAPLEDLLWRMGGAARPSDPRHSGDSAQP